MSAACATCLRAPARPRRPRTWTRWPRDRPPTATHSEPGLGMSPRPGRARHADPADRHAAVRLPDLPAGGAASARHAADGGAAARHRRHADHLQDRPGRVVASHTALVPGRPADRDSAAPASITVFATVFVFAGTVLVHFPHASAVLPVEPEGVARSVELVAGGTSAAPDRHRQRSRWPDPASGAPAARLRLRRHRAGAAAVAGQLAARAAVRQRRPLRARRLRGPRFLRLRHDFRLPLAGRHGRAVEQGVGRAAAGRDAAQLRVRNCRACPGQDHPYHKWRDATLCLVLLSIIRWYLLAPGTGLTLL